MNYNIEQESNMMIKLRNSLNEIKFDEIIHKYIPDYLLA